MHGQEVTQFIGQFSTIMNLRHLLPVSTLLSKFAQTIA